MGSTFARRADAVAETQRPRKVAATTPGCRLRPGTATGRRRPRPIAGNVFVEVLGAPGGGRGAAPPLGVRTSTVSRVRAPSIIASGHGSGHRSVSGKPLRHEGDSKTG